MGDKGWTSNRVMRLVGGVAIFLAGLGSILLGSAGVEPAEPLMWGGFTALAVGLWLGGGAVKAARSEEGVEEEELPTLGKAMQAPPEKTDPSAPPPEPLKEPEPFADAKVGWGHKLGDGGPGAGMPGYLPPDGGGDGG